MNEVRHTGDIGFVTQGFFFCRVAYVSCDVRPKMFQTNVSNLFVRVVYLNKKATSDMFYGLGHSMAERFQSDGHIRIWQENWTPIRAELSPIRAKALKEVCVRMSSTRALNYQVKLGRNKFVWEGGGANGYRRRCSQLNKNCDQETCDKLEVVVTENRRISILVTAQELEASVAQVLKILHEKLFASNIQGTA
jgi:hypothetical protein